MPANSLVPVVMMRAVEGPVTFSTFETTDTVAFPGNIADVFRCRQDQTKELLEAVEILEDDHHYIIERVPVREAKLATHGKTYPRQIDVTISPA